MQAPNSGIETIARIDAASAIDAERWGVE